MPVTFRSMQTQDKAPFRSFVRSLPRKDNYCLLLDVQDDQEIERWMDGLEPGQSLGVVALEGGCVVGYCNLRINDLPWTRHVGEICMSVSAAYRGRGIGSALAGKVCSTARGRGLQKLWARMAVSQEAAQSVFKSLGFHTEAILADFVKNENGLTEDLVIMSHDFGELWAA